MIDIPVEIEPQDVPYIQIHEDILADERISYKARGILAYLLSRRGRWEVRFTDIARHSLKDGKRAIQSGMAELVECGYATLQTYRSPDGKRFAGRRYVILKYKPRIHSTLSSDNAVLCQSDFETVTFDDNLRTALNTNSSEEGTRSKKKDTKPEKEERPPFSPPQGDAQEVLCSENIEDVSSADLSSQQPPSSLSDIQELQTPIDVETTHPPSLFSGNTSERKRKSTRRAGSNSITVEAQQVLTHLNAVAHRAFTRSGFIQARLNDGATVEDCTSVIDYLACHWTEAWKAQYLDQQTPFRPDNFDKNLGHARAWLHKQGGGSLTNGSAGRSAKDIFNAYLTKDTPHAAR